ncbi:MAG TPA: carboxypeptidase-like regulatory domain-containing protein [Candidatus Angelobacter sp.]|nr:carboxypeptidase-like regulatory domain-containing protein [Candidatus Angelobacter sp.]
MERRKSRVAGCVAALLLFSFIATATSSDRAPASVCTDYPSNEEVFIGTLISFAPSPILSPMRFESLEPLTGDNVEGIYSITALLESGSHCSIDGPPVVGERYLVVASRLNTPAVSYGCVDLKREADAAADIEYFRRVRSGAALTEVSGEARVTGGPPVKGAKVQLVGIAGSTQLISNAKGRFHSVLKPGTYEVTAEFPAGYQYESCGWSSITVVEHRCARLVVCAELKTSTLAPASK